MWEDVEGQESFSVSAGFELTTLGLLVQELNYSTTPPHHTHTHKSKKKKKKKAKKKKKKKQIDVKINKLKKKFFFK